FAVAGNAEFGTSEEAKAMLARAVMAVRADAHGALDRFNHNDSGFRDRDLFVFCFDAGSGKFTAHESLVTHDVRTLRDLAGKPLGEQIYQRAQEGEVIEIAYLWTQPGSTRQVEKRAFVTRAGE